MSTYLWIHIAVITVPLLLSFDKKVHFFKKWKALFPAVFTTALIYIIWDILFTVKGVWGFNTEHLTGIELFHLPLEEILFFITVPYASVFIYEVIKCYFPALIKPHKSLIVFYLLLSAGSIFIAVTNLHLTYTAVNFIWTAVFLPIFVFTYPQYVKVFTIGFALVLIPFIGVNGILTGMLHETPVVWYNNNENLGIRIITIPVEDFFYALSLIGINVALYEKFSR